jgi:histidinol-phosphate/aromatic aminotransferase/cobyric acid decarboxylase-like protein
VDIGRPAKDFRDGCAKSGVMVGRDFPPFEHSHVRVSIGTMAEMQKAVTVFRDVLRPTAPIAGGGRSGGRGGIKE